MNRRQRRHPADDPVTAAQEEASWSPLTFHIRATNQGKLLFRSARMKGWRGVTLWILVLILVVPVIAEGVVILVSLVRDVF